MEGASFLLYGYIFWVLISCLAAQLLAYKYIYTWSTWTDIHKHIVMDPKMGALWELFNFAKIFQWNRVKKTISVITNIFIILVWFFHTHFEECQVSPLWQSMAIWGIHSQEETNLPSKVKHGIEIYCPNQCNFRPDLWPHYYYERNCVYKEKLRM